MKEQMILNYLLFLKEKCFHGFLFIKWNIWCWLVLIVCGQIAIFIALFAFEIWWTMVRTIYQYPGPQHTNVHVADCIWAFWHSCDKFTVTSPFNVQTNRTPYMCPFEPQHNLNLLFSLLSLSMLSVRIAFQFFFFSSLCFYFIGWNVNWSASACIACSMFNYYTLYAIRCTLAPISLISFDFYVLRTFS